MLDNNDVISLLVCFGVSSFFGMMSLLTVVIYIGREQSKISKMSEELRGGNAVAISGNGNVVGKEKGPTR